MSKIAKKKRENIHIERFEPSLEQGLSSEQVNQRIKEKLINNTKQKTSKSYLKIFIENIFTYFNMIWLVIFVALLLV